MRKLERRALAARRRLYVGRRAALLVGVGLGLGGSSCGSETPGPVGVAGAAGSSDGGSSGSGLGGGPPGGFVTGCELGGFRCEGDVAVACDPGARVGSRDCGAEGASCSEPVGCVVCTPGEGTCADGRARTCNPEGTAFIEFECDPQQGMACDPDGCKGSCSVAELGESYVGCDYYPTVTINPVYSGFSFAVAVSNTGLEEASLLVTRGDETIATESVPPGELRVLRLPWVSELKGGDQDACQRPPDVGGTRLVRAGAYRLRSTEPVTVYQFNPLEYELETVPDSCPLRSECPGSPPRDEGCLSFSNDASLIFPVNVLTGSYAAMSWPSTAAGVGFVSIVGTEPDTRVNVRGAGVISPGAGLTESGSGEVVLGRGDVLQILAAPSPGRTFGSDISGTLVDASAPVQVISGSSCGFVPEATTDACDHLEQAMLPAETLGKDYLVTFPAAPGSQSPHVVRILPVQDDTTIQFEPPVPALGASVVRSPGQGPIELTGVDYDLHLAADQPVLVTHYLQGQSSVDSGAGDPSMAVAVPTAQFRDDYVFSVSRTYDFNFVNVVAPSSATVLLDGVALPESAFSAIGNTGYRVARHMLPSDREVFRIEGTRPFGIVVYGYGAFTSYMYPGGLDLRKIAPAIIR